MTFFGANSPGAVCSQRSRPAGRCWRGGACGCRNRSACHRCSALRSPAACKSIRMTNTTGTAASEKSEHARRVCASGRRGGRGAFVRGWRQCARTAGPRKLGWHASAATSSAAPRCLRPPGRPAGAVAWSAWRRRQQTGPAWRRRRRRGGQHVQLASLAYQLVLLDQPDVRSATLLDVGFQLLDRPVRPGREHWCESWRRRRRRNVYLLMHGRHGYAVVDHFG